MTYVLRSQSIEPQIAGAYLGWMGGTLSPVMNLHHAERFRHWHTAQEAAARYNQQHRVEGAPDPSFIVVECE